MAELLAVLLAVEDGEPHSSPRAAKLIVHGVAEGAVRVGNGARAGLTTREREVFALLGERRETLEIAKECGGCVKTVESHFEHLKAKLGLPSMKELLRAAVAAAE